VKQRASAHDAAIQDLPLPRPFGESGGDLELDFNAGPRPDLVTSIVCACLQDAEGRALQAPPVWDWTLHRRLQALLAIERAGGGVRSTLQRRCPHAVCGEPMELDLDLDRFVLPEHAPEFDVQVTPDVRLTVRLPSGADQRRWHGAASAGDPIEAQVARDLVQAVNGVARSAGDALAPEWIDPLADALEERDPLTALRLATRCPACGEAVAIELDLEDYLLSRARARQERLLDAVHQLARAYHWSEREILALPRERRRQYLARVREEPAP
jgi:hypothetical protein